MSSCGSHSRVNSGSIVDESKWNYVHLKSIYKKLSIRKPLLSIIECISLVSCKISFLATLKKRMRLVLTIYHPPTHTSHPVSRHLEPPIRPHIKFREVFFFLILEFLHIFACWLLNIWNHTYKNKFDSILLFWWPNSIQRIITCKEF